MKFQISSRTSRDKFQNAEFRSIGVLERWSAGYKRINTILHYSITPIIICFILLTVYCSPSVASEKWPGVDESVVEKYAEEHGRAAREPFINTDQGDLLLFVFLLAGAVGGFIGGYYWRTLTENRAKNAEVLKKGV